MYIIVDELKALPALLIFDIKFEDSSPPAKFIL
jgi:hypothetical protein